MTTCNSSDMHPNRSIQCFSSIFSSPSIPETPENIAATYVIPSSEKSRYTVFNTLLYSSKADHRGSPKGETLVSSCFLQCTYLVVWLVFVQTSFRINYTPPLCAINLYTNCHIFPDSTCSFIMKKEASKTQQGKQRGTPQRNIWESLHMGRSKLAPEGEFFKVQQKLFAPNKILNPNSCLKFLAESRESQI